MQVLNGPYFVETLDEVQKLNSLPTVMEAIDVKSRKTLQDRGMKLVPAAEVDMAAFRAAGNAAYEKLGIAAARDRVYRELGKKK